RAYPATVAVDSSGNLFIAGGDDHVVQRVDAATNTITTIAGNAKKPTVFGFSGDGGLATNATVSAWSVAVQGSNLYIADVANNRIRFVHLTPTTKLSPASLAFGALPLGTTSNSKPVGLKNTGGDDLTITGVSSSDAEFNPVSSCGSLVAPAQSCTISVAFTPSSYGKRTGVISVADNASNSPQNIKASGSGPHFA